MEYKLTKQIEQLLVAQALTLAEVRCYRYNAERRAEREPISFLDGAVVDIVRQQDEVLRLLDLARAGQL